MEVNEINIGNNTGQNKEEEQGLSVDKKQKYSMVQLVCCCKCFKAEEKGRFKIDSKQIWNKFKRNFTNNKNKDVAIKQNLIDEMPENLNEKTLDKLKKRKVLDPMEVLIHLYDYDNQVSFNLLKNCRTNPNLVPSIQMRKDLEFYIPQLITYMVFYKELQNQQLNQLLVTLSNNNYFFGHIFYWNLNSNKQVIEQNIEQSFPQVQNFIDLFLKQQEDIYDDKLCLSLNIIKQQIQNHDKKKEYQFDLGYLVSYIQSSEKIKQLKFYRPIYQQKEIRNGFYGTIYFFEDLFKISQELTMIKKKTVDQKLQFLKQQLEQMNESLPAAVYVPFFKKSIRNYIVLNIVANESMCFSTKERVPYYVCMEIFRPEEDLEDGQKLGRARKSVIQKIEDKFDKIKKQVTKNDEGQQFIKNIRQVDKYLSDSITYNNFQDDIRFNAGLINSEYGEQQSNQSYVANRVTKSMVNQQPENKQNQLEKQQAALMTTSTFPTVDLDKNPNGIQQQDYSNKMGEEVQRKRLNSFQEDNSGDQLNIDRLRSGTEIPVVNPYSSEYNISDVDIRNKNDYGMQIQRSQLINQVVFGDSSFKQYTRIRNSSQFASYKTWDLVHFIVKSGDNIKQEQLALQLVYQFDQIFKKENLQLFVYPYEIISMGPNCGIIEMIKDSVSIDRLKQKLNKEFKRNVSLKEYFEHYYVRKKELQEAKKNFCRSLAGYSLLCYFLQVKDRHNGNIMINQKGQIMHIDFGFFISNSPGRGIEFERSIPFKFNNEYLEVLGGPKSKMFQYFRKLFFQGFKALKKHQDKILVLVKMMYSGHSDTLPCFKGGERGMQELFERFNPKIDDEDGALNIFTQNLINKALNNYRTRWYDKYQYYFQGIFY